MSRQSEKFHFNLHTPAMTTVDIQISGFRADDHIGTYAVFFDDVLPAEAIAVFFHHTAHKQYGQVFVKTQFL